MWLMLQAASLAAGCGACLMASLQARPGAAGLLAALVAAGLFAIAYTNGHTPLQGTLFCLAAGAGAVSAAIDARHHLLPDLSTALIAGSGLLAAGLRGEAGLALLAAALSAAILLLAARLTRRPGPQPSLGEGDILLAAACATWAPPGLISWCLLLAAGLTAAAGALGGAWRRGGRMPFGPGLLAGYAGCVSAAPMLAAGAPGGG